MALPKLDNRQDREPWASHRSFNSMATHLTVGIRTPPGRSYLFGEVGG